MDYGNYLCCGICSVDLRKGSGLSGYTCIIYLLCIDSKLSEEIHVLHAIWVTTKKQNRSFIEKLPRKLNLRIFLTVAKVFKVFLATGLKIQEKQGADN